MKGNLLDGVLAMTMTLTKLTMAMTTMTENLLDGVLTMTMTTMTGNLLDGVPTDLPNADELLLPMYNFFLLSIVPRTLNELEEEQK